MQHKTREDDASTFAGFQVGLQVGLENKLPARTVKRIMGRRIIITNATILTLDANDTFLYPGVLEIRDDRVHDIREGSTAGQDKYDGETEVIDGTDKLVMPGLVDLHFHTSIAKVGRAPIHPTHPEQLFRSWGR